MGKASRKKRAQRVGGALSEPASGSVVGDEPRARGEAALVRLLRSNAPGRLSLAGAYAVGYGMLGLAQQEGEGPQWYHEIDPLDALFLGAAWPVSFDRPSEFANARDAWLRRVRGTVHGNGIRRFVHEAVSASQDLGLPVDDGELMLALIGRLEAAGLDQRRVPRSLLPEVALQGSRSLIGPSPDVQLPVPLDGTKKLVKRFWKDGRGDEWAADTPCAILRGGLRRFQEAGLSGKEKSVMLLSALYTELLAKPGEFRPSMAEHATAWALSLDEESPLVPVLDVLLLAPALEMSTANALGCLFALPAFEQPIPSDALLWTSSPGLALPRLAFELGIPKVLTRDVEITPDLLDWVGMRTRMHLSVIDQEGAADLEDADGDDNEDVTQEESDARWDERRAAVLDKIRKKASRTVTARRPSDRPIERIWNADGSSVIRIPADTPHGQELQAGLKRQRAAFREKFGREPGPDDPVLFDPDVDEPTPLTKEHFDKMMLDMARRADDMGIDPAFLHAWREVGYVVTEENMSLFTTAEILAFSRSVLRHQQAER